MSKRDLEELGVLTSEQLEEEFMQIVAQVTGANALADFDGQIYTTLPELFSEFLVEPNEYRCKKLCSKLSNISSNILKLRDNIQVNMRKLKFIEDDKLNSR